MKKAVVAIALLCALLLLPAVPEAAGHWNGPDWVESGNNADSLVASPDKREAVTKPVVASERKKLRFPLFRGKKNQAGKTDNPATQAQAPNPVPEPESQSTIKVPAIEPTKLFSSAKPEVKESETTRELSGPVSEKKPEAARREIPQAATGPSSKLVRRHIPGQPTLLDDLGYCPYNPRLIDGYLSGNRGFKPLIRDGAMTKAEADEFTKALLDGDVEIVYIKGEVDEKGQPVVMFNLMAFGQGRAHYLRDVAPTWKELRIGFQKKLSSGRIWVQFRDCGNPALRIWFPKPKPKPEPKPAPAPKPALPFLTPPQEPSKVAEKGCKVKERFNSLFGGGFYSSLDKDHPGSYVWTQQKVFLICTKPLPNLQVDIGGMYFGGAGWGRDRKYRYRWYEHDGGIAFKAYGKKWDADLCFTLGRLLNAGHEGKYVSKQTETVFRPWFHLNYRPGFKHDWFPEFEFNAQARIAIGNPTHRHSYAGEMLKPKPTNNNIVDATVTAWIKDVHLNPALALRPGIYATVGHERSNHNTFFQVGPILRLRYNGQEAATVGFGYKKGIGSQWQVFASARPDGILRGAKAGKITKVGAAPDYNVKLENGQTARVDPVKMFGDPAGQPKEKKGPEPARDGPQNIDPEKLFK